MLEITESHKEKNIYPIARRSLDYRYVILFFSEQDGVVIDPADSGVNPGDRYTGHYPCNNPFWEPVDITITG